MEATDRTEPERKEIVRLLRRSHDSREWLESAAPSRPPLATNDEIDVFKSLAFLLDGNPRRLKRIISVYSVISEVAKRKPLEEGSDQARPTPYAWV